MPGNTGPKGSPCYSDRVVSRASGNSCYSRPVTIVRVGIWIGVIITPVVRVDRHVVVRKIGVRMLHAIINHADQYARPVE